MSFDFFVCCCIDFVGDVDDDITVAIYVANQVIWSKYDFANISQSATAFIKILCTSLEGVVTIFTVFVNRKEGPRSSSTSSIFSTRSAARRPHMRGACPALVIRGGEVSAEEEKNLGMEGP